ncbi:MAG: hypothetical protein ACYDH6_09130 [Acidimicrobiales bacterium]
MVDLRRDLTRRLSALPDVVASESMFRDELAYWVNGKEIAHFEADSVIEIRLTNVTIRERRREFEGDPRIELRPSGADWLAVRFESRDDVGFIVSLVRSAAHQHQPPQGTAAKPPPVGSDLERRRRFH